MFIVFLILFSNGVILKSFFFLNHSAIAIYSTFFNIIDYVSCVFGLFLRFTWVCKCQARVETENLKD